MVDQLSLIIGAQTSGAESIEEAANLVRDQVVPNLDSAVQSCMAPLSGDAATALRSAIAAWSEKALALTTALNSFAGELRGVDTTMAQVDDAQATDYSHRLG